MKTIADVKLEAEVVEILEEVLVMENLDDLDDGDRDAVLTAFAMKIIAKVKEAK